MINGGQEGWKYVRKIDRERKRGVERGEKRSRLAAYGSEIAGTSEEVEALRAWTTSTALRNSVKNLKCRAMSVAKIMLIIDSLYDSMSVFIKNIKTSVFCT